MSDRNQRRHPRRAVLVDCQVDGFSGFAATRVSDLSATGCYVESRTPVSIGSTLRIRLRIADGEITLTGRVVHTQTGIGFGVQFEPLASSIERTLTQFLQTAQHPRAEAV